MYTPNREVREKREGERKRKRRKEAERERERKRVSASEIAKGRREERRMTDCKRWSHTYLN